MITVLIFTTSKEQVSDLVEQLTLAGEFRVVLKFTVPSVPSGADRESADAVVVWSPGNGSEGRDLMHSFRSSRDTIPFVIAVKNPDPQIAFEALLQDADYFLLPGTAADAGAGISKLIKRALEIRGIRNNIADQKNYQDTLSMLNKKLLLVGSVTRHDVMNQLTAVIGYNRAPLDDGQGPETD